MQLGGERIGAALTAPIKGKECRDSRVCELRIRSVTHGKGNPLCFNRSGDVSCYAVTQCAIYVKLRENAMKLVKFMCILQL